MIICHLEDTIYGKIMEIDSDSIRIISSQVPIDTNDWF